MTTTQHRQRIPSDWRDPGATQPATAITTYWLDEAYGEREASYHILPAWAECAIFTGEFIAALMIIAVALAWFTQWALGEIVATILGGFLSLIGG